MKNDLISRQMAIELIHSLYPSAPIMRQNRAWWKERYGQYIEVEKALEQLPSVQSEIIYCKDCRWQKDQSESTAWLPCRAIVTPSDFYCGRAERRTDG